MPHFRQASTFVLLLAAVGVTASVLMIVASSSDRASNEVASGSAGDGLLAGVRIDSETTVLSLERFPYNAWFSPDGTSFYAFTEEGLVVGQADGSGVRVIEATAVAAAWAPDSKRLAIATASPGTSLDTDVPVHIVDLETGQRTLLASADPRRPLQFLASGELAYASSASGNRLRVADPATGAVATQDITLDGDLANNHPYRISPDGRYVAILMGAELLITDLFSEELRSVSSSIHPKRWGPYAWSPSGDQLAFAEVRPDGVPEIRVYDVASGSMSTILQATERGMYAGVSWIPDSGWLVFTFYPTGTEPEERARYMAANIATGEQNMLFERGLGLRLSPDGRSIIFTRTVRPEERGNWIAALQLGGQP
jgi:Tol biopolymer transport system component